MRQRRSDAARNRELLVRATIECFLAQGTDIRLDAVARRAGVGNATLYRHFPTREDLYEAVFADIGARIGEVLERYTDRSGEPLGDETDGNGFDVLHRFIVEMLTATPASAELGRLADARIDVSPALQGVVVGVRSVLTQLLERAQRQGRVRPDVDIDDLGLLVSTVPPLMAVTEPGASNLWRRHLALLMDSLRADGTSPLPDPGVTGERRTRLARTAARNRYHPAGPTGV